MADFYPLIANTTAGQIQEIPSTANLNLSGCNVINTGTYYGSGAGLTSIPGGNVTGTVATATTAGTVTTAAQPNITSVGTLTTLTISGKINEIMNTVTATVGTTTLDLSTNSVYKIVMAANTTLAFSNPPSSGTEQSFKLYANTNNGSNTITWPASVKWQGGQAPTQTTTANKTDVYSFSTNDGGTTYFAYVSGLNF